MLLDELKVPFRWYESGDSRIINKTACEGYRYKLITPMDRLLPIMLRFKRDAVPHLPITWKIYNSDTGALVYTASATMLWLLEYYSVGSYDYIVYKGQPLAGLILDNGFYYSVIELADGYKILTSEDFYVDCDSDGRLVVHGDFSSDFSDDFGPPDDFASGLKKYTKIEWWNNCDIGNILYQTGYHNIVYFEGDLVRDEPLITEEGTEDGKKDFIPSFIKYIDKIKFDDYVPEFILNAILAIKLCKFVVATTKENVYTGEAKEFKCDFTFINDCYAKIDCSFQQETTFLRANCCDNNTIINKCSAVIDNITANTALIGSGPNYNIIVGWTYTGSAPTDFEFTIFKNGVLVETVIIATVDATYNGSGANDAEYTGYVRPRCLHEGGAHTYGPSKYWSTTAAYD